MKRLVDLVTTEVVRGYEACDGMLFDSEEECSKYEKTCRCIVQASYIKCVKGFINQLCLFGDEAGYDDTGYDIVPLTNRDVIDIVNKVIVLSSNRTDNLVPYSEAGKIILVYRDMDENLTGWWTSFDAITSSIKKAYDEALSDIKG